MNPAEGMPALCRPRETRGFGDAEAAREQARAMRPERCPASLLGEAPAAERRSLMHGSGPGAG